MDTSVQAEGSDKTNPDGKHQPQTILTYNFTVTKNDTQRINVWSLLQTRGGRGLGWPDVGRLPHHQTDRREGTDM